MTLTEQQKQAFREKAASAKVQSKLKDSHAGDIGWYDSTGQWHFGLKPLDTEVTIGTGEEAWQETESQAAGEDALNNVSRETFQRSAGLEQANLDPYTDENGTVHFNEQLAHVHLDDIPWEEAVPTTSLQTVAAQQLVEGFVLKPGMSMEQVEELSEQVFSYIGAEPVHVGKYVGRWIKVLGGVALPLEGDVVDEETGEVNHLKWTQARLKLAAKDDATGENIIVYGGGNNGLQFVRHMTSLYGPGDWGRPKEMLISHEIRKNGHVLYHFRHRRIQQ